MLVQPKNWSGDNSGILRELRDHVEERIEKARYDEETVESLDGRLTGTTRLLANLLELFVEKGVISFEEMNGVLDRSGIPSVGKA